MYFTNLTFPLDCANLNLTEFSEEEGQVIITAISLEFHFTTLLEWRRFLEDETLNPQELVEFINDSQVFDPTSFWAVVRQYRDHLELRKPQHSVFRDKSQHRWRSWGEVLKEYQEWRNNRS